MQGTVEKTMGDCSDLDRQIEQLRRCEVIKEAEVKALCAKAREILVEESNVQRVDSPVTVSLLSYVHVLFSSVFPLIYIYLSIYVICVCICTCTCLHVPLCLKYDVFYIGISIQTWMIWDMNDFGFDLFNILYLIISGMWRHSWTVLWLKRII